MGEPDRPSTSTRVVVLALGSLIVMPVAYFLLPLDAFGPDHPVASWLSFGTALTLIAFFLLLEVRAVNWELSSAHPGLVIPVLLLLIILVFATTYLALSKDPGEMDGLTSRLDALYFTLVTTATIGYGDITPRGQSARMVTIMQILFTFVFLSAGAAAFSQQLHRSLDRRRGKGGDPGGGVTR